MPRKLNKKVDGYLSVKLRNRLVHIFIRELTKDLKNEPDSDRIKAYAVPALREALDMN